MSSDEEHEWFADGLTEEILNSLVRTPDLLVASRTSSFQYKGQNTDVSEIAAALDDQFALAHWGRALYWEGQLGVTDIGSELSPLSREEKLEKYIDAVDAAIGNAFSVSASMIRSN